MITAFSNCPYAIASHDTNSVFNYANEASLQLFKTNWDEMIGVHSSVSASKSSQSDRNKMLKEVARIGFVEDYKGTRMAFDGSLFQINDAIIWNIVDSKNNSQGQAVLIMDHSLYESKKYPNQGVICQSCWNNY